MELTNQRDESVRASKLTHDAPEAVAADGIEGFRQVHKGAGCTGQRSAPGTAAGVQRTPCRWFHAPFWQQTILQVFDETVQEDSR